MKQMRFFLVMTVMEGFMSIISTMRAVAHTGSVGVLDVAYMEGPGRLRIGGWTFASGHPGVQLGVRVLVNGIQVDSSYEFFTGVYRPDVNTAYGGTVGNYTGYYKLVAIRAVGVANVCVESNDEGFWSSVGCLSTDISQYGNTRSSSEPGLDSFYGHQFQRNASEMPFRYARLEGMSATAVVAIDNGV